ncbi:polysaccharide deacetylase family protein [Dactylosporangium sp. NPDC051484]|uniref:polysaccharide deacetylase family protein n=1 Tax=Dactylosporangium sp. NPDC051484 TaxID=3154942 RepID=UPI00344E4966
MTGAGKHMWSRHRALGALLVVCALLTGCGAKASGPAASSAAVTPGAPAMVSGSAAAGGSGLSSAQLARIPHFPPAPAPAPITVPAGPSAGWYSAIPTDQPVAFITIDDGWTKVPEAEALLKAAHVPVTLFLEINAIKADPGYFTRLEQDGAVIEAHTISHPELKGKSYDVQRHEICGGADELAKLYGRRPVLFRPPFGDKDATTLKVVHDCGMKAAFFWKETTDKGIVRYQEGNVVKPGDILLMHFRPAFVEDFLAVLQAISNAGLTPARLEDYIA